MSNIWTVARNTFREAVRDRVLYNLVFFALLMMGTAILVGQVSIGIEQSVMISLGLTAISVIGIFIAVFIGVGLVSKEMDKRTLYALLAKPVERWQFLLGKFAGLLMTLTINTAAMTVGLYLALWSVKHPLTSGDWYVLVAVYLILLKLGLIVALAMLFSCFTTPLLAILFTLGLYVAGLFAEELRSMQKVQSQNLTESTMKIFKGISYLLPNFQNFNVMGAVAHGRGVAAALVWQDTGYALVYGVMVLAAAAMIFSRKNLK
jgi:ABC-type transport system involved in multi-copper enzyme maturation permease subunit